MKKMLAAVLLACAVLGMPPVRAEGNAADATDMNALRAAVRTDKKALVASTLALTPGEAAKFWPIYDDYQRALDAAHRQRTIVLEDLLDLGKPLSDLYAKALVTELIAADEAEVKARRKLQTALLRALPAKKAARYLQLESKIRAYQAYDIAGAFPLVK